MLGLALCHLPSYIIHLLRPHVLTHTKILYDTLYLEIHTTDTLPDGVLKSVVCSSREHPVATPELFYISQPLELRSVDDLHHKGVELNVTMDRIIKHLHMKGHKVHLYTICPRF